MSHAAFTLLEILTFACAAGVVCSRNAVNGAMCLLGCLAGVAGFFLQLHANLLAFVLILVYAGAVVMLFLFIVMLLDMQGGQRVRLRPSQLFGAVIAGALMTYGSHLIGSRGTFGDAAPAASDVGSSLKEYAYPLFTAYLLPVQVIGFLLLISMLGVILLSRRPDEKEGSK